MKISGSLGRIALRRLFHSTCGGISVFAPWNTLLFGWVVNAFIEYCVLTALRLYNRCGKTGSHAKEFGSGLLAVLVKRKTHWEILRRCGTQLTTEGNQGISITKLPTVEERLENFLLMGICQIFHTFFLCLQIYTLALCRFNASVSLLQSFLQFLASFASTSH